MASAAQRVMMKVGVCQPVFVDYFQMSPFLSGCSLHLFIYGCRRSCDQNTQGLCVCGGHVRPNHFDLPQFDLLSMQMSIHR